MASEHLTRIRTMKACRPFVPFRIVMSSGAVYAVRERFQVAVSDTRVGCYTRAVAAEDRFVELPPDQIVAVERLEDKPAA